MFTILTSLFFLCCGFLVDVFKKYFWILVQGEIDVWTAKIKPLINIKHIQIEKNAESIKSIEDNKTKLQVEIEIFSYLFQGYIV